MLGAIELVTHLMDGLLYPGLDRNTGTLLLPSGIVLLYFPPHHVINTLSAKVVHNMLSGCLSFLNISMATCCGRSSLTDIYGTRYVPGMSNWCGLPSPS